MLGSSAPVGARKKKKRAPAKKLNKTMKKVTDRKIGEAIWHKFEDGLVYRGVISDFTPSDRWPFTVTYTDGDTETYTLKQMKKIFKRMRKIADPGVQPRYTPVANITQVPRECPILEQNRSRNA